MEQFNDLEVVAPGISLLSEEDHIAIQRFTILWSLFEANFLDCWGSVHAISEKINRLNEELFRDSWFENELTYFRDRYYVENEFTYHFRYLNFRRGDNEDLVKDVLSNENENSKDQLIACLIIVYRFRNNLFHGSKWAYGIQDQKNNFNNSASLLKKCIVNLPD